MPSDWHLWSRPFLSYLHGMHPMTGFKYTHHTGPRQAPLSWQCSTTKIGLLSYISWERKAKFLSAIPKKWCSRTFQTKSKDKKFLQAKKLLSILHIKYTIMYPVHLWVVDEICTHFFTSLEGMFASGLEQEYQSTPYICSLVKLNPSYNRVWHCCLPTTLLFFFHLPLIFYGTWVTYLVSNWNVDHSLYFTIAPCLGYVLVSLGPLISSFTTC